MSISKLTTNGLTGAKYDTVSADNYYMEPIATTLLTGTGTTITFSNIPQTYKHLQLRIFAQTDYSVGSDGLYFNINNDSATTYRHHQIFSYGTGITHSTATDTNGFYINRFGNTATGYWGNCVSDIFDYTNPNKNKTVRSFGGVDWNGSLEGAIYYSSGLYLQTTPITTIKLSAYGSNLISANSRFSLYGLKG